MKWRQFFTPVTSIGWHEAEQMVEERGADQVVFLDVRQPSEYEKSHMPGAVLMPMGELDDRLEELDPKKAIVVYWAVGGRSRVAAQMLNGTGFAEVFNLSGGMKARQNPVAIGPPDLGLDLFEGAESIEQTIIVGFGLEQGLRDFYLDMQKRTSTQSVRALFGTLAEIEIKHQEKLLRLYHNVTNTAPTLLELGERIVQPALEGGLTTEQYLDRFGPNLEANEEVVAMAMSIEAQALDLYWRAASRTTDQESAEMLRDLAEDERAHMQRLAELLDSI